MNALLPTAPTTVVVGAGAARGTRLRIDPRHRAVFLTGAALTSVILGLAIVVHPDTVVGVAGAAAAVAVLALRPQLIWGTALFVSLFVPGWVRHTEAAHLGSTSIYLSDVLPIILVFGALALGVKPRAVQGARMMFGCSVLLLIAIMVAAYRTLHIVGIQGIVQAREVWPFLLVPLLPLGRRFADVSARQVADAMAVAAVALGVRSLYLLLTGHEARAVTGVQRIFQTWEPFIAAAIGLTLFAYILAARNVRVLHICGLAATTVPVLFSFFRTAWVLMAFCGAILFFLVRDENRRGRILAGVVICVVLGLGATTIRTSSGPAYGQELATRFNEISVQLDSYRAQEYVAVWNEIRVHPWIGSGFDTPYKADFTTYLTWSHNAYEWYWWRMGIIGLGALLGLLLATFSAGVSAVRRRLAGDDRGLAIGLLAGLSFTALAANLHENFENYQTNLFIAVLLAQVLVLVQRGRDVA